MENLNPTINHYRNMMIPVKIIQTRNYPINNQLIEEISSRNHRNEIIVVIRLVQSSDAIIMMKQVQ